MQVYDKVIETTRELLKPFPVKELNRNHANHGICSKKMNSCFKKKWRLSWESVRSRPRVIRR